MLQVPEPQSPPHAEQGSQRGFEEDVQALRSERWVERVTRLSSSHPEPDPRTFRNVSLPFQMACCCTPGSLLLYECPAAERRSGWVNSGSDDPLSPKTGLRRIFLVPVTTEPSFSPRCAGELDPAAVPRQPGSLRPRDLPAGDHQALLLGQHDSRPGPLDLQLRHLPQPVQEEVAPLQRLHLHQLLRAGGARPGPHLPQVGAPSSVSH